MSSGLKSDPKLSQLTQADARLLVYGSLCMEGKLNSEKLASLLGMKKASVATNYRCAKAHLQAILEIRIQSPTKDGGAEETEAAKKTRSGTKGGAVKEESTNDEPPTKRRKTVASKAASKAASEPAEESTQADTDADLTE
ncbi:uncharacterized protein N7479_010639 [Penicillium vulpinum]|uniref:Uncharacterized protein n=1 Tax=Penicillium vulpinum TaxID=29845 RepID=A0A1V6S890_9EURO|nr:uncharacterized protein N7479_010639 [Penicillium vulpinum]KAJ5952226.1 hypothetical protein N7479_010639 [Penicillium vulpinum]OQE10262.1 hypothetical protein PENVUL_c004G02305 [Penicillium vulpinum]